MVVFIVTALAQPPDREWLVVVVVVGLNKATPVLGNAGKAARFARRRG